MDAADGRAELLQGLLGLLVGLPQQGEVGSVLGLQLGAAERHRQRHQPLLHAVVQVALDPPALGLEGVDQPGARAPQVVDRGDEPLLGRVEEQPRRGRPDRTRDR